MIVVAAAALGIVGLVKGVRPACQVTTVTHAGGSSGGTATTKVCGGLDAANYIYVLAIVGVLLLPDVKSLKIGGLEFERLTDEVAKQTSEVGQLRQEISTVVSNTNSLSVQFSEVRRLAFTDFREYFRTQRAVLEKIRPLLPTDPHTIADLRTVDEFAARIDADDLNPVELMEVLQRVRSLLAAKLTASGSEGDTIVGAQKAEDVLPGILGGDQAS